MQQCLVGILTGYVGGHAICRWNLCIIENSREYGNQSLLGGRHGIVYLSQLVTAASSRKSWQLFKIEFHVMMML